MWTIACNYLKGIFHVTDYDVRVAENSVVLGCDVASRFSRFESRCSLRLLKKVSVSYGAVCRHPIYVFPLNSPVLLMYDFSYASCMLRVPRI